MEPQAVVGIPDSEREASELVCSFSSSPVEDCPARLWVEFDRSYWRLGGHRETETDHIASLQL